MRGGRESVGAGELENEAMEAHDERTAALKKSENEMNRQESVLDGEYEEKDESDQLVLPPLKGDNPSLPKLVYQAIYEFLRVGRPYGGFLVAYYHHHWHYLDMILGAPNG